MTKLNIDRGFGVRVPETYREYKDLIDLLKSNGVIVEEELYYPPDIYPDSEQTEEWYIQSQDAYRADYWIYFGVVERGSELVTHLASDAAVKYLKLYDSVEDMVQERAEKPEQGVDLSDRIEGPNLAMPVPPDLETYTEVLRLLDVHGIEIRETLNYRNGSDLSLYEYYADAFTYYGVRNGRTFVTNELELFGDYVWVHPSVDCVKHILQLRYPIEVKPQPEPATSNAASNKVLVTQSPFKFEYAVHDLAPFCLNDLRFQLSAYIEKQRRMSSASAAYLYLTVTPEGEMRFTNHGAGQIYLQDTGEFTRDVKRMLAGKKPTVSLAPMPSGIPEVTEVDGEQYKTTRILNDGYYIGELETDELVYKDISVAEAIVYALNADSGQRFDALRVHFGDGHWKRYHAIQYLFREADKAKYQLTEKKVIRRVMHISGGMSCKIGRTNWDKFKDSTLRVSKSNQLREGEERYWATPRGFFVRDKIGVELTGLYLFVK